MAAVAVGLLTFGFRYMSNGGFANDHFVHLARAQQMLLGGWPVRDFVDPGLPLMYVVSAVTMALAGHALLGETVVVFLAMAVAAGLTFWLAWKSGAPMIWALVAVAFQVLMMPRSYSYPKLLVYAVAIGCCWRAVDKPSPARAWELAILTVVAFLFRHDHGLFVAAASLAAIAASGQGRFAIAGRYVVLTALLLLPWALYVQFTLGLDRYARSAIEFSRVEAALTRGSWPSFQIDVGKALWQRTAVVEEKPIVYVRWRAELTGTQIVEHERALGLERIELHEGRTWRYHPDVARLDDILADPAVEDTNHLDEARPRWWQALLPWRWNTGGFGPGAYVEENAQAFLYYLFFALPAAFLVASAMAPAGHRARVIIVALLALLVDAAFLRNPLEARLPDVVVPQTLLIAWALAWGFGRAPHAGLLRRLLVPAVTLVLACLTAVSVNAVGNVPEQINRIGGLRPSELAEHVPDMTRRLRSEFEPRLMPSDASAALVPVFKYLQECTERTDRFAYIGFGPDLYFFASRGFAGGHVAWLSTYYSSEDEQRLTRDRMAAERVPLIIVPDADEFRRVFPIVAAHVDSHYRRVGEVSLGSRRGTALVDTSLEAVSTYAGLGWPCFK